MNKHWNIGMEYWKISLPLICKKEINYTYLQALVGKSNWVRTRWYRTNAMPGTQEGPRWGFQNWKESARNLNLTRVRFSTFVADIISVSNAKALIPSNFLLEQAREWALSRGEFFSLALQPFRLESHPSHLKFHTAESVHNSRLIANVSLLHIFSDSFGQEFFH